MSTYQPLPGWSEPAASGERFPKRKTLFRLSSLSTCGIINCRRNYSDSTSGQFFKLGMLIGKRVLLITIICFSHGPPSFWRIRFFSRTISIRIISCKYRVQYKPPRNQFRDTGVIIFWNHLLWESRLQQSFEAERITMNSLALKNHKLLKHWF